MLMDALGAAIEAPHVLCLAAAQHATLLLELLHSDGGQRAGAMMDSRFVVDLMDGDGGVHHVRLDDFPLNDGLDGLMDVADNEKKKYELALFEIKTMRTGS